MHQHAFTRNPIGLAVVITAAIAAATSAPALAQSKISILVNDQPITSYEIQARGKMLSLFTHGKQGAKDATDQLIEERLMMQEAKRRGMTMSDSDVDEEVAKRAKQSNLSGEQFQQALRQAGVDPLTFRAFLSANMSWARIVRARFQATEKVSDQDVTAALNKKKPVADAAAAATAAASVSEYMLQPILFIVPQGSDPALAAKMKAEATAFRSGFKGCDQSLEQVAGRPGIVVKPTIRRETSQISKAVRDELAALEVGGVTSPQVADSGIQILAVCAKQAIAGATVATQEVRDELTSERGNLLARRYLRDLRADAVIEYK